MNPEEKALSAEFGLRHVYPSELFYKTHKISQKDFLSSLREAKEANDDKKVQKLVLGLYSDDSICGRRGVKPLRDGQEIVRQKMASKVRHRRFAQKVSGNQEGMSYQQLRQSGILRNSQV